MRVSELQAKAPKVLLYGRLGSGKTALAMTCGACAQLLDLDEGWPTARTFEDKYHKQRQMVDVEVIIETNPDRGTAFMTFKNKIMSIARDCMSGKYPYKVLIIDSLTALVDYSVRYVMGNSGSLGKAIEIQHWGLAFHELKLLMQTVRSLPIAVILIAHDQTKNIKGQGDETVIGVPGAKLHSEIPRFWDEVWFCRQTPAAGGKTDYKIQTKASAGIACRTRMNIPDQINMDVGMPHLLNLMGYDILEASQKLHVAAKA